MTTRVAIYSRYSSDLQRDASIEDQIRSATDYARKQGWQVVMPHYSDHAISGSSMSRPGLLAMMRNAAAGQFDMVLTEGLDRISRDQEHIAGIYKRLNFAGVKIFSLTDGGEVNDLHIGLKGTMNALYLKDLALKTIRGQRGRIENGKAVAGCPYGYEVVRKYDATGEPIRGERAIVNDEAIVLRRIFEAFAAGKSARVIAAELNKDGIKSPTKHGWSATTINGERIAGYGIINNEIYIGRLVWNRMSQVKNPDTGRRVKRPNPRSEWIISEVPELRIIDQDLWDKVKAKQRAFPVHVPAHEKRRPKSLFSYLIKCGCCDGGFSKISTKRFGCSNSRNKGNCDNRLTIAQEKLEATILNALQGQFLHPEFFSAFCKEYTNHLKKLTQQQSVGKDAAQAKLSKLAREKVNIIEAIKQGIPASEVKEDLQRITDEREATEAVLKSMKETPMVIEPDMAGRYQQAIKALRIALGDEKTHYEAADLIRSLVDKIVLTPDKTKSQLTIDLHGDLAGILSIASHGKADPSLKLAFDTALNTPNQQSKNLQYLLSTAVGLSL